MHTVVERLFNLKKERESEATCIEILLTSPIRCDYSYIHQRSLQQIDVLDVPDVVEGSLQGLNELELVRNAEGKLKDADSYSELDRR